MFSADLGSHITPRSRSTVLAAVYRWARRLPSVSASGDAAAGFTGSDV